MILSYHPCFEADKNLLCAGREPDDDDLAAIRAADAVILPQGCYRSLYEMAGNNCGHVFPNFDARFKFPGKIGQARLFKNTGVSHPGTETFPNVDAFSKHFGGFSTPSALDFPFVFKFDWGGEGDRVFLINSFKEFKSVMRMAKTFETTGQTGFVIQEYIPAQNRSLRVVVIGRSYFSYWRIQENFNIFASSLAAGAVVDADSYPDLQDVAVAAVQNFCHKTGINLAGFDILFSSEDENKEPLFLEINYFFGRRGLGGSETFYEFLNKEIEKWIDNLGLTCRKAPAYK